MKPMSSVYRWVLLPALFILAPAGCKISHASQQSSAAPTPPAPPTPQRPGSKEGDVPFTPTVLDRDPLAESLLESLRRAGPARHGEQHPAQMALKKSVDIKGFHSVAPLGKIECYGTEDPDDAQRHSRDLMKKVQETKNHQERRQLQGSVQRAGCVQDIRYAKAEDVVSFDREVLGAHRGASPFYTWVGSSGRTAPRWQKDNHGNRTIVATWYFLRPEASGYEAPGKINKPNHKDHR